MRNWHRHQSPRQGRTSHVLLHSTNGQDSREAGAVPCPDPVELFNGVWICRMPDLLRDVVYQVCEPRNEPQERVFRQYGQLYTIAHFAGPWTPGLVTGWDGDGLLSRFVTLSHLVHPTSTGFGSTAVLTFGPNGEFKLASPGPCRGITEHAFCVPGSRNWLSQSECKQIKTLFHGPDLSTLPERVARAVWSLQRAAYEYFFEVRTMLVVFGLDSLVHIRIPGTRIVSTSRQFKERVVLLASDLGIPFTSVDTKEVWDHRSDVVHGRDPWGALRSAQAGFQIPVTLAKNDPMVTRYLICEQILRSTALRCLADISFASNFTSDQSVERAYPI
jgi:hypothetical protein